MVNRVRRLCDEGFFADFFTGNTVLIPAPGSAPIRNYSTPWIGERICEAMATAGLGREFLPIARRVTAVAKSAYQASGERPTATVHFESIAVQSEIVAPSKILLVDDVVTKRSTLLGLASRVHETYPTADIRAFAMIRTKGLQPNVESIREPNENGRITRKGEHDANRVD